METPSRPGRPYLAFFDVDYTLVACSSGTALGVELLRGGTIGPREILSVLCWNLAYRLGLMDESEIWHRATAALAGEPEAVIQQACSRAHARHVVRRTYVDAVTAIREHRAQGGTSVLVSAGPRPIVRALAEGLGVECADTCWANVVDGRVGDLRGVDIPFGDGKKRIAERYCRDRGVAPAECWAYGDSGSDIPLLGFVGHPVAVNPKPALQREARRRGWRIARWQAFAAPHREPQRPAAVLT